VDVAAYIKHRLEVAGGKAVTFAPEAAALVADLSRGLPRRVNVLCDRALQEGASRAHRSSRRRWSSRRRDRS
jgi:general secretion pathway protein A